MVEKRRPRKVKKVNFKSWFVFFGLIFLCVFTWKVVLGYRKSVWKKGKFNFVLASEPVLVFSLSPQERSLTVVKIPQNTFIEVTRGFGLYRVESVYPLGELEGKGGQLLQESAQEFLGVPVEGWIKINSKLILRQAQDDAEQSRSIKTRNSKLDKEDLLLLKKQITSWGIFLRPKKLTQFLKEELKTNLTFWDLAKIWLNAKKVSSGKIIFIDLEEKGVLTKFSLPDGQIGKKSDPMLIDNVLQEFFFEPKIRNEKVSIEVLNGTDYPGLAQRAARIIANMGGKVSKVGDSKERPQKCQMGGKDEELKSFTAFKIKSIFDCQVVKEEHDELSLIIGESYPKKLFSKE